MDALNKFFQKNAIKNDTTVSLIVLINSKMIPVTGSKAEQDSDTDTIFWFVFFDCSHQVR